MEVEFKNEMLEEASDLSEPVCRNMTAKCRQRIEELQLQILDLEKLREIGLRFWQSESMIVEEKQ